jgi:hypothetical protein
VLLAALSYITALHYGMHLTPHWPFLTR